MENDTNILEAGTENQESSEEFPSAEIVYASTIRHYEYERERKQVLETKAGILLTLLLGLVTLMISKMKIPETINLSKTVDFIVIIVLLGVFISFLEWFFSYMDIICLEMNV